MRSASLTSTPAAVFAALGDPTRLSLLRRLSSGSSEPIARLAADTRLTRQAVTKHLKVLEHAGLISRSRIGQQRPARLEPAALAAVSAWLETYRRHWEQGFDRLDDYLTELQHKDDAK